MDSVTQMKIPAPWGTIAMVSWGDPSADKVLLVHGRQDSLSTFRPLMAELPPDNHYVAFDMPGNGLSDLFPIGVKLTRFHFVRAMEEVVDYLKWKKFVFIGHSMGCEQGIFYNAIYPNRITVMVFLDAQASFQRIQQRPWEDYQKTFYDSYYDNYKKINYGLKTYTKEQAVSAVSKARGLTREQAETVLDRNLIPVGDNLYRLSWDLRLRMPAPQNYPNSYYLQLMKDLPPTLLISATNTNLNQNPSAVQGAKELVEELNKRANFDIERVVGNHDVHLARPDVVGPLVRQFLGEKMGKRSKL